MLPGRFRQVYRSPSPSMPPQFSMRWNANRVLSPRLALLQGPCQTAGRPCTSHPKCAPTGQASSRSRVWLLPRWQNSAVAEATLLAIRRRNPPLPTDRRPPLASYTTPSEDPTPFSGSPRERRDSPPCGTQSRNQRSNTSRGAADSIVAPARRVRCHPPSSARVPRTGRWRRG